MLFDIDGTLLDSGGAGTRSLEYAFMEVLSIESAMKGISLAGKTDVQIIREALTKHGIPSADGAIPNLINAYLKYLAVEIGAKREDVLLRQLKLGARDLLDYLLSAPGLSLGLLTGNVQEGAWIKLGSFGIHRYFSFGAFGCDHEDRTKLLPIAVRMFEKISGFSVDYRDCVVVGDTPLDIGCAKPHGAYTVAVSTGHYSVSELEAAGADAVFDRLPDGRTFLNLISLS